MFITRVCYPRSDEWGSECLIFSYIRRLGPFLGVNNLEIQFFISEILIYFGGMKKLRISFNVEER